MSDAHRTVRNAGWLVGQRVVHVAAATLFAVAVPRLMGPDVFGQYSLLTSVSMWFAMLSGLGAVSLMSRIVPALTAAGDTAGLRKLFSSLLTLRTGTGVLTALSYMAVVALVLGERDWVSASLIAASDAGTELFNRKRARFQQWLRTMLADWTEPELAEFARLMRRFNAAMAAHDEGK